MELPLVPQADRAAGVVHDTRWASEARAATGCAALLLGLSLTIEAGNGTLAPARALLWCALAALLFAVLLPSRVEAAPGRLTVRGLTTRRTVRTDRLTSVRWSDGVAQRLILRDAAGGRAEVDPRVLVANPPLWRLLEADARVCQRRGTLLRGGTELDRLARRVDRESAHAVFRVSGLE
ncbi:hypothetical protein AB0M39_30515 [Streptomyces sp. NPDC051907]|uniref:hypothetical protein n=1 Tax=Streptomyces sp. NPDC051907 TaxID=3155284 RepID=UPI0034366508